MGQYTQAAYDDLLELERKLKAEQAEALHSLGEAAEGDNNTWHDNGAFDEANRRIREINGRVAKIKRLVDEAEVVEKPSDGSIGIGSNVTYRFVGDDETEVMHLCGEYAVSGENEVQQVSTSSPFGAAVFGSRPGEVVTYTTPNGRKLEVEILEVL